MTILAQSPSDVFCFDPSLFQSDIPVDELYVFGVLMHYRQACLYPPASLQPTPCISPGVMPPLHMSKPSRPRFPRPCPPRRPLPPFPDNLVPNLIASSVPTHPSQHPHLHNMQFLDMCVLDWPTLRSIQQSRSNYHSVKLTFKSRWDFLITQDSRGKPPFHPSNPNAMCDIIIDATTSWILRLQDT
ncbi:hypothetical protein H5410_021315 [Solanum commersonii]|uniref:Uncharacterized protein n=1 Tax=Solanum commersonii TaxID=4109 RepID=A0A9J5ZBL6_SOLCO|nr:hypothetical protein H5410_021315 [Solanum commersonii]